MKLFDTHAHYLDEHFDSDRDEVLLRCRQAGVEHILECCCDLKGIDATVDFVKNNSFLYGALGVHPHSASELTYAQMDRLAAALSAERIVAVGEIGLDYHWELSPKEVQKKWFDAQINLAISKSVPIVVHDREAHGDTMDILRANKNGLKGIMHCFSASYEIGKECVDLGLYIAFGGSLTFKNATRLQDAARRLPLDRLLVETDCPYMTPVPHRGKRNDSTLMHLVVFELARLHNMEPRELGEILYSNSLRALCID